MPVETGVALQLYVAVLSTVVTLGGMALAWYFRTHVISQVKENSKHRRFAEGTDHERDIGQLGEMRKLEEDIGRLGQRMDSQHEEVVHRVDYAVEFCRRIAESVDKDVNEPRRGWEGEDDD